MHGHYDDDVIHGYHDACDWNDSCDFDDYASPLLFKLTPPIYENIILVILIL